MTSFCIAICGSSLLSDSLSLLSPKYSTSGPLFGQAGPERVPIRERCTPCGGAIRELQGFTTANYTRRSTYIVAEPKGVQCDPLRSS